MENQLETTVDVVQTQVDFRTLLAIEILAIGGGDIAVSVY